jgi:hypothetical protein
MKFGMPASARGVLPHGFQVRYAETVSFRTAFVLPPVSPGYRSPLIVFFLSFRSDTLSHTRPDTLQSCPAEAVAIPTRKSAGAGLGFAARSNECSYAGSNSVDRSSVTFYS